MTEQNDQDIELEKLEAELLKLSVLSHEEETAKKQQSIADKKALIEAVKKHGRVGVGIHYAETPMGMVIVRKPTMEAWRMAHKLEGYERIDTIVYGSLVHPSAEIYRTVFEKEYPYLPQNLYTLLSLLAGLAQANSAAK